MKNRIISLLLCIVMMFSVVSILSSCGEGGTAALVIMTDNLDGLFNPFFSTSATDGTIVSMTQIGMLTTGTDANGDVVPAYGDGEAVVTKDFMESYDEMEENENPDKTGVTTYTFVIKNGIQYSDGHPLTIEDVLFNMYLYLDPVYTGSSTMYSTDIIGLSQYRLQQNLSGGVNADEQLTTQARNRAANRIKELINVFQSEARTPSGGYETTEDEMRAAIASWNVSEGYKQAVSINTSSVTSEQLLADYEKTLELFKKELESDYESAKNAYTDEPYKSHGFDEITSFMYMEGYVDVEFGEKDGKQNADKSVIKSVSRDYPSSITTKEAAVKYVYDSKINSELHIILTAWATATELQTLYIAQAKEVILKENVADGELLYPSITGIVSLGHTTDIDSVTIGDTTYAVAHDHNPDGTPANPDEYDVLQIKINGVDPKAIWNFAFSVAPQHYYGDDSQSEKVDIPDVDIANNEFGVLRGSFDFMTEVVQSHRNVTVPMGAGAYMATNNKNDDVVDGTEFFNSNVVYFKANPNFLLGAPKTEKIRYQVVPTADALNVLLSGTVHYVTPQLTPDNEAQLNAMQSSGYERIAVDQLGYGYIGINAGLVPNIYLRRAIMAAMNTSLALQYYDAGTAEQIFWPMSTVSWAYPKDDTGENKKDNGHTYAPIAAFTEDTSKAMIRDLMAQAAEHESYSDNDLKVTFTIAGSNLTDHPTYQVFQTAQKILNDLGWQVEVIADTQALTKLSTGSLQVWAAAWGTTVDPDMYQVYHKNSTASSVRAWGYNAILSNETKYWQEMEYLNQLSEVIDEAREITDREDRAALYEEAMGYVLDLAIELPVYQRKELYAYNANVINAESFPDDINPYTTPLDRIWEIELTENAANSNAGGTTIALCMFILCVLGLGAFAATAAIKMIPDSKKRALLVKMGKRAEFPGLPTDAEFTELEEDGPASEDDSKEGGEE